MKYEEIQYKLSFNEKESNIYMPNEIFEDLINKFDELYKEDLQKNGHEPIRAKNTTGESKKPRSKRKGASSNHIAFAYTYYYLITYLYRYSKYGQTHIDTKIINQILGFAPNYSDANFIVKKGGLLDELGYTTTTTDYPISWSYDDCTYDDDGELIGVQFGMFSDLDKEAKKIYNYGKGKNYKVKQPIKAFCRTADGEKNGTFYDIDNTFFVPFEVFMYCMDNKKIGCKGFYLYSYLKSKNQWYGEGYDVSFEKLEHEVGFRKRTMGDVLDILRKYNLVTGIHNMEYYCVIIKDELKMANTYIANDFESFYDEPMSYKKITVMKKEDYQKILDKEAEEARKLKGETIQIPLEALPY